MRVSLLVVAPLLLTLGCGRVDPPGDSAAPEDTAPVDTDPWCVPTADLDGYGKDWDCDGYASDGYVGGTDCDDANAAVHPGAAEVCDTIDNDCDGAVDGPELLSIWYADPDGDGYGDLSVWAAACEAPAGYAAAWGDCATEDPAVFPGAAELCNGVDDDCDGVAELDGDGDGQLACEGDCDDADPNVHLGATELSDGVDTDCDGVTPGDEVDLDGDGWQVGEGDCDDSDRAVSPGAVETCGDARDDDCDGSVDADCSDCDLAVPNDFPTIQEAIDASSTGDVVCVAAGTWTENLDFGGAEIRVLGVAGPAVTFIDGGAADAVVRFASREGPGTVLEGFTIENGLSYDGGGGISIVEASPTLVDLVLADNQATWDGGGGGLYVEGGDPTVTRVTVTGNGVNTSYCAALYGVGGGIVLTGSNAVLDDVVIRDNSAGETGGGLYVVDSSVALTNVTITSNFAGRGGAGGVLLARSSGTLTNVLIADNATSDYWGGDTVGGGLRLAGSDVSLTNVVIEGNAAEGEGGGLYVSESSPLLVNTVIAENTGGVYVSSGSPTFSHCDVWGNTGGDYGGLADPTGTDGNQSADPLFGTDHHLDAASPLVDAGSPSLSDPDGSPSDIGLFGGAGAASWDVDGDGWAAWWLPGPYDAATSPGADCDDGDATVFPGSGC